MSAQTVTVVTALLAAPRRWRYGYDLSMETGLPSGTLYPILMRLCDRGWLETGWEDSEEAGRPPRHIVRLNARGVGAARDALAELEPAPARRGLAEAK